MDNTLGWAAPLVLQCATSQYSEVAMVSRSQMEVVSAHLPNVSTLGCGRQIGHSASFDQPGTIGPRGYHKSQRRPQAR